MSRSRVSVAALPMVAALALAAGARTEAEVRDRLDERAGAPARIEWIGAIELPRGTTFEGVPVGGLSSLAWDAAAGELLVLSDDRSEHAPARLYRMRLDLSDGRLDDGDLEIVGSLPLVDRRGEPFPRRSLDPEGLALAPEALYVSSEGEADAGVAPFVAELDRAGRWRRELPLAPRYRPDGALTRGVRENLGFESVALETDGRHLLAATENALAQDGPAADVGVPSHVRIARWRLDRPDELPREFLYRVEPLSAAPPEPGAHRVNGLVDLLALSGRELLALERQFVTGVGVDARLYRVDLEGASEVSALDDLDELDHPALRPARKRLLLDFAALGVPIDNLEGIAFGPPLADGRRSLLVVSDDNFAPASQRTQLLAFAVDDAPVTVARIQGAAHRSPIEGQWVTDVAGMVTATIDRRDQRGFWIESLEPDADPATSEGLFVEWPRGALPDPGHAVRVGGRVAEQAADERQLPVTRLRALSVEPDASASTGLPAPVHLALASFPTIDDDALARFEPGSDALDAWESVEGMRVAVGPGVVTGPTTSYGELVLRPDGGRPRPPTAAGGGRRTSEGGAIDRVFVSGRLGARPPQLAVGSRVVRPFAGVVDYSFSNYRVLALESLDTEPASADCAAITALRGDRRHLTVATLNVENLSVAGPPERFGRLATVLVERLGAPDVVLLEEIQDDSGPTEDEVVSSERTLAAVVEAVAAAGGPRYTPAWIDPELHREGGQPGGNIRVAFLFDPARLSLPRRGAASAVDAAAIVRDGRRPRLEPNPGRVAPRSAAFDLEGTEGVRRSLAIELIFRRRPIYLIANHWTSKYEDDRDWGARQPPAKPTTAHRLAQAREIRAFTDELLAADPEARIVVAGDLNDHEWTEPIVEISRPPLINLTLAVPDEERYTFNFEGDSQVLDHFLVSPALARGARLEIPHLNTDCPAELRSSDHDPQIVRLRVN